ncbi:MAG: peptide deformylase [Alphaproteobacteria bacterium]|nr:peptide deformylase [Alphaproteobacteria bacterium]
MAVLPIITAPDPRLKLKSKPVSVIDAEVRRLLDDMVETMYAAPGIGLSAIQVGIARRLIVVDAARGEERQQPLCLVNPAIVWHSAERVSVEEGCLSLPEQYDDLERPARIRVRFLDAQGVNQEREADGLLARCIQHEMDHLDGVLFVDRLSAVKRNMILRKLIKARRQRASG